MELTGPSRIKPEELDKHYDILYKHIGVIIVWDIEGERPAYYMLFLRKYGEYIGRTKTLRHLEDAEEVEV